MESYKEAISGSAVDLEKDHKWFRQILGSASTRLEQQTEYIYHLNEQQMGIGDKLTFKLKLCTYRMNTLQMASGLQFF